MCSASQWEPISYRLPPSLKDCHERGARIRARGWGALDRKCLLDMIGLHPQGLSEAMAACIISTEDQASQSSG